MIIIAGDSWGCGEWSLEFKITHTGLEQYLQDDGYKVINISHGGSSNDDVYKQLSNCLYILSCVTKISEVKNIFVFQTEWHRDHHRYHSLADSIFDINYIHTVMSNYYYRLSELAIKYNVRIGLIGGCSDTIWLDKFEIEYPGVYIACHSMINLCLTDNHRRDNAAYNLLYPVNLAEEIEKANTQNKQFLLDQLELTMNRAKNLNNYPQFFAPDFKHPNRHGHLKLYDFLKQQKLFKNA